MAEFDDLRQQLQRTRSQRDAAADRVQRAKEDLKRLAAEEVALNRTFNPRDQEEQGERERIKSQRADAEGDLKGGQAELRRIGDQLDQAIKDFSIFTDPREAIGRFNDQTPILLFPVRLETRFKTVVEGRGSRRQLWVRVYPDECSIDTFEETLSENEVANAQLYWTGIWQAGGIEEQERAAWRGLVASHGSGRAAYIVENYQPSNLGQNPSKAAVTDVILVVATAASLGAAEETATAAFWRKVWLADGVKADEDAARAMLEAAVGAARAAEIIAQYRPANMDEKPRPPLKKSDVTVSTAFVIFPAPETIPTKQQSWSRAPTISAFPDRFVFIGYHGTAAPLVVIGNPVPSPLVAGPDPSADPDNQLKQENGELIVPNEIKWMIDFDRAVEVGMGFRIDLDGAEVQNGFDRVLVLGLRLSADEKTAKNELETLFQHHQRGRSGFSLIPQGTPTNNTESSGSGFTRSDDADSSYDDYFKKDSLFDDSTDWLKKRDGQWLAESIGIDSSLLKKARHSDGVDQIEARAMSIALWPGTLGYWMETMMKPVFSNDAVENTRDFLNQFVIGRGAVPAVRIGKQPYGILPTTAFSRMRWMEAREGPVIFRPDPFFTYLRRLRDVLREMRKDWANMAMAVSHTGGAGDAHQTLLDIVGLHPGAVEFSQRYAESVDEWYNRLAFFQLSRAFKAVISRDDFVKSRVDLLARFGYTAAPKPDLLHKVFFGRHNQLNGPLIDDVPLSETAPIRSYTAAKKNYLEWLIDAANTSLETLRAQSGFLDDKPPLALLYILFRYALEQGYKLTSIKLRESLGIFSLEQASAARSEPPFIHVKAEAQSSESRYQLLYAKEPAIHPTLTVADYITRSLGTLEVARYLGEQIAALEVLKNTPTARLERVFAEHIDCCSYRLDAWMLGLVHYQLALMRNLRNGEEGEPRSGVYLGAYAWLENLRPEQKTLTPVQLDAELDSIFNKDDVPPLQRDSANQGHIHAPSLNHAVAAAVLRNGYISDASPENRQTMAVNLTSERVRIALSILEGIRGGQSLGALLGYQFERGLHDRHNLAEVDKFIFPIRREFPLAANRLASTQEPDPDVSIESLEARNVMDGLALIEHIKKTISPVEPDTKFYPFGKTTLPAASAAEIAAIDAEVQRMLDTNDAVADLALAEGVFQAVQGNYDRVAGTLDSYTKGNFPPEPDVVHTPMSGAGLTHRVAIHLKAGLAPNDSPIAGLSMTPRAQADPALNHWLATVLPSLDQVGCKAKFRNASTDAEEELVVTLRDLKIQPLDLLYLIRNESKQAMSELDDRIVSHVFATKTPAPDPGISIAYLDKGSAKFSVFQLMPLVGSLRKLALSSRALRASDLALATEGEQKLDANVFADPTRVTAPRTALTTLRGDLDNFRADLAGPPGNVDDEIDTLVGLFQRAARFAIPQTGWGFAYEWRKGQFKSIKAKASALVQRWNGRLTEFSNAVTQFNALPPTATVEEKTQLLQRAEQLVSTTFSLPPPAAPADLDTKRDAFDARRLDFAKITATKRTRLTDLLADIQVLLPVTDFDLIEFSIADEEKRGTIFREDALNTVTVVLAEIDRRLGASGDSLTDSSTAAGAAAQVQALTAAVKSLLGDDVGFIPEFKPATEQDEEIANAFASSRNGDLFDHLTNNEHLDFPVDEWLYGIARVREKMWAWEHIVMLSAAFGKTEPELTAMQLPFKTDDDWLGLKFPATYKLEADRLLYTAHFVVDFAKSTPQTGLLLDEWTEVIPGIEAMTGVSFHYDRPNNEPPQTMLLVTPTAFSGAWQWADLVDALNETLDLARMRAVEPDQIDATAYATFLPATIMATTQSGLTISANLAVNNDVGKFLRS
jgi:hypothetical protein